MFSMFLVVIETLVKVWENSKKLWKQWPADHFPTAFLVLPNFHLYIVHWKCVQITGQTTQFFFCSVGGVSCEIHFEPLYID